MKKVNKIHRESFVNMLSLRVFELKSNANKVF